VGYQVRIVALWCSARCFVRSGGCGCTRLYPHALRVFGEFLRSRNIALSSSSDSQGEAAVECSIKNMGRRYLAASLASTSEVGVATLLVVVLLIASGTLVFFTPLPAVMQHVCLFRQLFRRGRASNSFGHREVL